MNTPAAEKNIVWRRLAIVTVLLFLLIGPNFGPIPDLLGDRLSIEGAVIGLLISFIIGFSIIIAVVLRMTGGMSLGEWLKSVGWGAPSHVAAIIVGTLLGLSWGAFSMMSVLQFDPEINLAAINLTRIVAALLAAFGTILEDTITRGYVMNQLQKVNVPNWLQILASALLFALYHTLFAGLNIFSLAFSLVYGLMLSGLFIWGKRSLTPVILGHAIAVLIGEPFTSMLLFMAP